MAQSLGNQSPPIERPNMSDLRIVLVGKVVSENNRVGNFILNGNVFGKKTSQPDVDTFSRTVERRNIKVISTTHLLKSTLSLSQIAQKVSALSHPEPHVIILVLQHKDFSEKDRERLASVLNCFGEQAMKRTMILTTDDEKLDTELTSEVNEFFQEISKECGGGRLQLQNTQNSQLLQKVDEIITRSEFKGTQQSSSLDQELRRSVCSVRLKESATGSVHQKFGKYDNQKEMRNENSPQKHNRIRKSGSGSGDRPTMSIRASRKADLNLVLCGSDVVLKASVSKRIRELKTLSASHQTKFRSMSVKEAERIHGRVIRLVELPAVNQLSEEEVMRQTLHCVSLCDPGVHVFLIIVPAGPLNDDDKAEIEKIQKIFDSREHFMVLFTTPLTINRSMTNVIKSSTDSQSLISRCGGQMMVMGLKEPENSRQIPDLLDYIENMKTEPYSLQMCVKAQENRARRETEEKCIEELKKLESNIGAEDESDECLRIVLIGRTGNGKSATGNTILGREEFESDLSTDSVTTVCKKGVGEVDGRSVAVVDTPGLFDTELTNDQAVEEIMKCVSLSSPGPHVFVIVLSLGRFTREESDTVDLIKKIFGHKSAQFSIVLFTRGDDLKNESIEDYVKRSNNGELKKLIRDCGNRFLAFSNTEKQDKTQVIQLLNIIEEVKKSNDGRYFTNSMFEEAEMSIKKRMEQIMKERERETQTKYEMEIQGLIKIHEKERKRADKEIMEMKNQIEQDRKERDQQRREIEELQREKSKIDLKPKHEEEMRKITMKFEARKKAEEMNDFRNRKNQWNLDLKDKLQEDLYDSQEEQYEDLQEDKSEKENLIKRKKWKRKPCVII